jgi:hypothetical protein
MVSLVSAGKINFLSARLAAADARSFAAGLFKGNTARRRFGIFFDFCLALQFAAPPGECPAILYNLL